ncbi:MAG: D-alanine--D-alanine ligase family protein [Bacillota bacterium]|nr:D-alanine--D-alanine ligase family protein [Bacillota bacterium]
MDNKKSLLILFGGASSEHEVSCASAASVLRHINDEKYDINTIGITKEGNWLLTDSPAESIDNGSWEKNPANRPAFLAPGCGPDSLMVELEDGRLEKRKVDVVFPILHGKNGEDGTMQGLLQITGIPYVGSGATASAASMDKAITKAILEQSNVVNQAKCIVIHKKTYEKDPKNEVIAMFDYFGCKLPLFVKPANAGSSVGISKVKTAEELPAAIEKALKEDDKVLIEEAIVGREIEVAVIGNDKPEASCIGEIFAANEFYDYEAKYQNAQSKTGIVFDLDEAKENEIRNVAVKIYEAMGCKGLARVDFFLKSSGKVIFNEINTLPGFTNISMYPKLWESSGLPYDKLIDRLIELALEG